MHGVHEFSYGSQSCSLPSSMSHTESWSQGIKDDYRGTVSIHYGKRHAFLDRTHTICVPYCITKFENSFSSVVGCNNSRHLSVNLLCKYGRVQVYADLRT